MPHDYIMSSSKEMADDYLALGETEKAEAILSDLANKAVEYISWYLSLDDQRLANSYEECVRNFYILDELNKTRFNCVFVICGYFCKQRASAPLMIGVAMEVPLLAI